MSSSRKRKATLLRVGKKLSTVTTNILPTKKNQSQKEWWRKRYACA
jgi:hypothetical protein